MDNDLGKIYSVINDVRIDVAIVKTNQKNNHDANQRDIARLYKWMWAISFIIISASLTITIQAIAG